MDKQVWNRLHEETGLFVLVEYRSNELSIRNCIVVVDFCLGKTSCKVYFSEFMKKSLMKKSLNKKPTMLKACTNCTLTRVGNGIESRDISG